MKKKTHQQYVEQLPNLNVICLEKYINSATKLKHKCLICEIEWYISPNKMLSKEYGCNKCRKNPKAKTTYQYKQQLKIINKNIEKRLKEIIEFFDLKLYLPSMRLVSQQDNIPSP